MKSGSDALVLVSGFLAGVTPANLFAAVGEPFLPSEERDAAIYAEAIGAADRAPTRIETWQDALQVATSPGWDRNWWDGEETARRSLHGAACQRFGEEAVFAALSTFMQQVSLVAHGPAAVAMSRSGVADPGLARAAAGAFSQSCHQAALATLAGQSEHYFHAKFRLFQGGRWPLCLVAGRLHLF